jgi:hypothetical protein
MHLICTPMLAKIYSCKKWVLQLAPLALRTPAPHDRDVEYANGTRMKRLKNEKMHDEVCTT